MIVKAKLPEYCAIDDGKNHMIIKLNRAQKWECTQKNGVIEIESKVPVKLRVTKEFLERYFYECN